MIRCYRAYLDKRRSIRPEAEYREPTQEEWAEFRQHFHERKLELGTCGRPYGTPCQTRARLCQMPDAANGPQTAWPPRRDNPQPRGPHHRSATERLARRGEGTADQPRRLLDANGVGDGVTLAGVPVLVSTDVAAGNAWGLDGSQVLVVQRTGTQVVAGCRVRLRRGPGPCDRSCLVRVRQPGRRGAPVRRSVT